MRMGTCKRPSTRHQHRSWTIIMVALTTLAIPPITSHAQVENTAPHVNNDLLVSVHPLPHDHKYHGVIYNKGDNSLQISADKSGKNYNHQHQHSQPREHTQGKAMKGINPHIYPSKDRVPDIHTPQVAQWLTEIDWSKVPKIPIAPSLPDVPHFPKCPPDEEVDKRSCWWSCDGCFASDDVVTCPLNHDWGLTYDDGPSEDTPTILRYLKQKNLTATFFIVGSRVLENPDTLRDQVAQGHHIAMHTWSHSGLTTLTNEQIVAEVKWTEKIIRDVTGLTTKYIRPPFGDVDNRVREILRQLGYKTVIWTPGWDTNDWRVEQQNIPEAKVLASFKSALSHVKNIRSPSGHSAGPITLEHDVSPKTISLSQRLIVLGIQHGLHPMNLAQCLADEFPYQRGSRLGPNGAVQKPNNGESGSNARGIPGMTEDDFKPIGSKLRRIPLSDSQQAATAPIGLLAASAAGAGYILMV